MWIKTPNGKMLNLDRVEEIHKVNERYIYADGIEIAHFANRQSRDGYFDFLGILLRATDTEFYSESENRLKVV